MMASVSRPAGIFRRRCRVIQIEHANRSRPRCRSRTRGCGRRPPRRRACGQSRKPRLLGRLVARSTTPTRARAGAARVQPLPADGHVVDERAAQVDRGRHLDRARRPHRSGVGARGQINIEGDQRQKRPGPGIPRAPSPCNRTNLPNRDYFGSWRRCLFVHGNFLALPSLLNPRAVRHPPIRAPAG